MYYNWLQKNKKTTTMLFYFPTIDSVRTFQQLNELKFKYIKVESNFKRNECIQNDEIFNLLKNKKFWIIVSPDKVNNSNEFCKNLITNLYQTTKYNYIKNMEKNEEYYNSEIDQSLIDIQKMTIGLLLKDFV